MLRFRQAYQSAFSWNGPALDLVSVFGPIISYHYEEPHQKYANETSTRDDRHDMPDWQANLPSFLYLTLSLSLF